MKKEENVCMENKGAEKVAEAIEGMKKDVKNERESCPTNSSAAPAKFKDADALARAYGALEAEFTRRSQRIKELEKTVENLKAELSENGGSGAEKLRKNAEARRSAARQFDRFVKELGKTYSKQDGQENEVENVGVTEDGNSAAELVSQGQETAQEQSEIGANEAETLAFEPTKTDAAADEEDFGKSTEELVGIGVGKGEAENQGEACEEMRVTGNLTETVAVKASGKPSVSDQSADISAEELYARVYRDEKVRLRIIGEYLASLGRNAPPLTVGGAGALVAPPLKPKNIADAGSMALQYFKKPFDLQ